MLFLVQTSPLKRLKPVTGFFLRGLLAACLMFYLAGAYAGEAEAKGYFEKGFKAGFRTIGHQSPDYGSMQISVWYPTMRGERDDTAKIGEWEIRAIKNARPATGPFPIIMISHDMVSHSLAHHDLASFLAENGFVVIAVSHAGDNVTEAGAVFRAALLYYRPRQMLDALARVVEDPTVGPALDREDIGLLGVGAGAVTVLQLAGVDINDKAYAGYCEKDRRDDLFCTDWARVRLAVLEQEAGAIRAKHGPKSFAPEMGNLRAIGMLTPGGLFLMNQADMARVSKPVGVFFAGRDDVYESAATGEELAEQFSKALAERVRAESWPEADHASMCAPLPERLRSELMLKDGRLRDGGRKKAAEARNEFFLTFFTAHLGEMVIFDKEEE